MTLPLKRRIEKSLGPLFDPLYLVYLLVDDLRSWRYFPKWFSSFRPRSLVGEAKPWIPFEAANWLGHYMKPYMKVFEYGSGGSTIFFAERVTEVISIEHDKKWHALVTTALAQRGLTNCTCELHEPRPIAGTPATPAAPAAPLKIDQSQTSRFIYDDYYAGTTVHEYVEAIDDHTFDLVLVDGRVRTECMQHAIPKIRPGGYLMLDNSNNADVAAMVRKLRQSHSYTGFRGMACLAPMFPSW